MTYFNGFNDKEDVFGQFCVYEKEQEGINLIYAYYNYEDYSGSAFVLFEKNGKLYEVNAGHCSCYGLEEGWSPEETSVKELKYRLDNGSYWIDDVKDNLAFQLKAWKQRESARKYRASKKG